MTDLDTIRRVQNVIYLPTKKQSQLPVAILVGAALASLAAVIGFLLWSFVSAVFSIA